MKILITGGAGYIGATVASACLDAGHTPVILDDLSTGVAAHLKGKLHYIGSIADRSLVERIAAEHPDLYAVIHCAARIVVSESVRDPLGYYASNVADSIVLLDTLRGVGLRRILFSSTAAVYAADAGEGVSESSDIRPLSPYARSKLMVERVLEDAAAAGDLRAFALRYFNPIGVDPNFRTGPTAPEPTHVLALLQRAAAAGTPFTVTGTDWPTRDGSGLRDFIHVWDLARAHVRAVERFDDITGEDKPFRVMNIGTGGGTTVFELTQIFAEEAGADVGVVRGARRPGDSAGAFASVELAATLLGWRAEHTVSEAIRTALDWERTRV